LTFDVIRLQLKGIEGLVSNSDTPETSNVQCH